MLANVLRKPMPQIFKEFQVNRKMRAGVGRTARLISHVLLLRSGELDRRVYTHEGPPCTFVASTASVLFSRVTCFLSRRLAENGSVQSMRGILCSAINSCINLLILAMACFYHSFPVSPPHTYDIAHRISGFTPHSRYTAVILSLSPYIFLAAEFYFLFC